MNGAAFIALEKANLSPFAAWHGRPFRPLAEIEGSLFAGQAR
ncbi:hypothetical protein B4135_2123 [Caldibacillus debilis]|uniref:Uncharacterized protein n=1 Tax=Caldibacillus debilis TaxID=301148 RepID=A0A150M526_9BACI|nr:hypothetical protein B4135_2123 [Caldibacillus debilis]